VLNASNEVAVEAFLEGRIGFPRIPAIIEECLETCATHPEPTLENFRAADGLTRSTARRLVEERPVRVRVLGGAP
jgi:1-deoxy-D-xylulose-5-phosphate reductoisomerase